MSLSCTAVEDISGACQLLSRSNLPVDVMLTSCWRHSQEANDKTFARRRIRALHKRTQGGEDKEKKTKNQ
jgi:hypothetical protein